VHYQGERSALGIYGVLASAALWRHTGSFALSPLEALPYPYHSLSLCLSPSVIYLLTHHLSAFLPLYHSILCYLSEQRPLDHLCLFDSRLSMTLSLPGHFRSIYYTAYFLYTAPSLVLFLVVANSEVPALNHEPKRSTYSHGWG
jgi:hypothetical protein